VAPAGFCMSGKLLHTSWGSRLRTGMNGSLMCWTAAVGGSGRSALRQPGLTATWRVFGSIAGGSSYRWGYFVG
jgi:hypothetical protein